MSKWLARFSFSFIIVGAVLLWEGNKLLNHEPGSERWRWMLCFVGAGVSLALGAAGVRARHRDQNEAP